jgi:hypothetical protein
MSCYLIDNCAYYRFSPNDSIKEKQVTLRNSHKKPVRPLPPVPIEVPLEHSPLPIINLVPTEQPNVYRVDLERTERYKAEQDELIACQEQILTHNHNKIWEQNAFLDKQKETIKQNEEQIAKQDEYIEYQIGAIHNYDTHIQQQIYNYNINLTYISQQAQQLEHQKQQIEQQQETIRTQQEEIDSQKEELEQLRSQLAYHNQMLGAFNTMVQNPEYFTQLMGSIMCASMVPPPIIETDTM